MSWNFQGRIVDDGGVERNLFRIGDGLPFYLRNRRRIIASDEVMLSLLQGERLRRSRRPQIRLEPQNMMEFTTPLQDNVYTWGFALDNVDQNEVNVADLASTFRNVVNTLLDENPPRRVFLSATAGNDYWAAIPSFMSNQASLQLIENLLTALYGYTNTGGMGFYDLTFVAIRLLPNDGGARVRYYSSCEEAIFKMNSIRLIPANRYGLCLLSCIYAMQNYEKITWSIGTYEMMLNDESLKMGRLIGVDVDKDVIESSQLQKISDYFKLHIVIVKFKEPGHEKEYEHVKTHAHRQSQFYISEVVRPTGWRNVENTAMNRECIYVLLHRRHYNLIRKPHQLLGGKYFCHICLRPVHNKEGFHRCADMGGVHGHKRSLKFCNKCKEWGYKNHNCDKAKIAKEKREKRLSRLNSPYIQTLKPPKPINRWGVYDCETAVVNGSHVATHVIVTFSDEQYWLQKFPELHWDVIGEENKSLGEVCGVSHYLMFQGYDCMDKFAEFLCQTDGLVLFAHNGARFDNVILLPHMLKRINTPPTFIADGTRLLSVEWKSLQLTLRDSYLLIPSPLSGFPKAFGLKAAKGFYPYELHTYENLWGSDYIQFPKKSDFQPEKMKADGYKNFEKWYNETTSKPGHEKYYMNNECIAYCLNDVLLLHAGMTMFRQRFQEIANFDCFKKLTIASLAMTSFRVSHLKDKTIIDQGKQRPDDINVMTDECCNWLTYIENKNKCTLNRSVTINLDGEEVEVDGVDEVNNVAYMYYGRYKNSHPLHVDSSKMHPVMKLSNRMVYDMSMERVEKMKQIYNDVVLMWDFEWTTCVAGNPSHMQIRTKYKHRRLTPRMGFHGGRTEPWATYCCVDGKRWKIAKTDVTSLYPSVMHANVFPTGVAVKLRSDFIPLDKLFGFCMCRVKVDQNEAFPVLPVKLDGGKLLFPVGEFVGTFTHVELQMAVYERKNTKILEVYEQHHFPESERTANLFSSYIQSWFKLKLIASGLPDGCHDCEEYLKKVKKVYGLDLKKDDFDKNPVNRSIAKLFLNSLWGKFCEKPHCQSEIIETEKRVWDVMKSAEIDESSVTLFPMSDKFMCLTYRHHNVTDCATKTNINVACFVTAYARIHLYRGMMKVVENGGLLLYGDTDSVVFAHDRETMHEVIEPGNFMGEWEPEDEDDIVEFASIGPKSYTTKKLDGETCVHAKGFTLTVENSEHCSHDCMVRLAKGEQEKAELVDMCIARNTRAFDGVTRPPNRSKVLKFTLDKRNQGKTVILGNGSKYTPTLPIDLTLAYME